MCRVGVVIVNWNSGEFIKKCIHSVLNQTFKDIGVLLIDNASEDNSVTKTREEFPDLKWILNKKNIGYSSAHNLGLKSIDDEFHLTLNPDVILTPDYIEKLIKVFEDFPSASNSTGKLLSYSAKGKIDSAGVAFCSNRNCYILGKGEEDREWFNVAREVPGGVGAGMMYRRKALYEVAIDGEIFDEDFFAYVEEVDLDWRLRLRGWVCRYEPTAVAYHLGDISRGSQNIYTTTHFLKNRYLVLLKNDSLKDFLFHLPGFIRFQFTHILPQFLMSPGLIFNVPFSFFKIAPKILKKRKLQNISSESRQRLNKKFFSLSDRLIREKKINRR